MRSDSIHDLSSHASGVHDIAGSPSASSARRSLDKDAGYSKDILPNKPTAPYNLGKFDISVIISIIYNCYTGGVPQGSVMVEYLIELINNNLVLL